MKTSIIYIWNISFGTVKYLDHSGILLFIIIIFKQTGTEINLSETDVLIGYSVDKQNKEDGRTINHIILIANMSISKFKYGKNKTYYLHSRKN